METTTKKSNRAGTKNKTWCGVPMDLYRRRKAELSKEDFRAWWFKKTGRQLCIRNQDKPTQINNPGWAYVLKLQKQIDEYKQSVDLLDRLLNDKMEYLQRLESRSWIQRLFNSKV